VGGGALTKCKAGRGLGPKPETEPFWLGLGCAVWNGNEGWCVGVAWWHVAGGGGRGFKKYKVRRGIGSKPETEPFWLDLGCTMWNGNRGWCVGVARWHIAGGGCRGVVGSRNTRRGGGLGQKPETEPPWLSFGLQLGCKRGRGVPWGHGTPSRANSESGDRG
jgi:hypothetical protein